MSVCIAVRDEVAGGKPSDPFEVEYDSERVTVRDLVRGRVLAEVAAINSGAPHARSFAIEPTETERSLNGPRPAKPRLIDAEAQCEQACKAFARGAFFVLVDDRQVDSLDEEILLSPATSVTFLRLVPLVGG